MKYRIKIILILLLSFLIIYPVFSQKKYSTQIINGVEYYVYRVQPGEGLYSISKRFNVSQEEIAQINPNVKSGLKAGQSIIVPKKAKQLEQTLPQETDDYFLHKVINGQTLFSISRKYQIPIQDIVKLNPELDTVGLLSGATLKIPKKKLSETVTPPPVNKPIYNRVKPTSNPTSALIHKVGAKETLYSIANKYHITVKQILDLNPSVEGNIIKEGTPLLIPRSSSTKKKLNNTKKHYKIAYFLPFMANSESINPTAVKFIQFYMGALLAINNVKNKDIEFEVLTYDIEKSETKLYDVLNNPEMQKVDLIFGPAYTLQIPILADFARRRKIYTVIPFSSNVKYISSNPYVFQFNPNDEDKEGKTAYFLRNNFKNQNILFVRTGRTPNLDKNRLIKQELNSHNISYQEISSANIQKYLSSNKKNIILFDTDKYSHLKEYLTKLYQDSYQYDVAVVGEYSWRGVIGQKPKMYYVSPFNGTMKGSQFYEMEYKKFYGDKKPLVNPRFDLLGYDLTNCFISAMQKNDFDFRNKSTLRYKGVQSDFVFNRQSSEAGYVNRQLYILEDAARNH